MEKIFIPSQEVKEAFKTKSGIPITSFLFRKEKDGPNLKGQVMSDVVEKIKGLAGKDEPVEIADCVENAQFGNFRIKFPAAQKAGFRGNWTPPQSRFTSIGYDQYMSIVDRILNDCVDKVSAASNKLVLPEGEDKICSSDAILEASQKIAITTLMAMLLNCQMPFPVETQAKPGEQTPFEIASETLQKILKEGGGREDLEKYSKLVLESKKLEPQQKQQLHLAATKAIAKKEEEDND